MRWLWKGLEMRLLEILVVVVTCCEWVLWLEGVFCCGDCCFCEGVVIVFLNTTRAALMTVAV